jgi:hypothetical protein
MARKNVYLPEDLAESLEHFGDRISVSEVCQRALREEVRKMQILEERKDQLGPIEIDVIDPQTWIVRVTRFTGRWLVEQEADDARMGFIYNVALTKKGQLAVWSRQAFDPNVGKLDVYEGVKAMEAAGPFPAEVMGPLLEALEATERAVELDI